MYNEKLYLIVIIYYLRILFLGHLLYFIKTSKNILIQFLYRLYTFFCYQICIYTRICVFYSRLIKLCWIFNIVTKCTSLIIAHSKEKKCRYKYVRYRKIHLSVSIHSNDCTTKKCGMIVNKTKCLKRPDNISLKLTNIGHRMSFNNYQNTYLILMYKWQQNTKCKK